ncbi:peptide ABC transporter substrate-binding protein [Parvularcula sp. IMCC14364]|uniref:peptide ABC transporter substrate-binding protein n=1 Tax=Parvularcula sp. IMCC14364 TaxID=3067902 RepID=UPI00274109B7|nr:peptide ABC transporter substrate-binding protein [Parvularcula sp. IMCC14364]
MVLSGLVEKIGRKTALAVTLAATLLVTACSGGSEDAVGPTVALDEGVVMNRGNGYEPNTLDPHQANGTWENNIIGDMMVGLYTEDADAKPVFGAAVAHEISEDGLTHTFKIREDMVWSDGEPVTADVFIKSWQRILDPTTAAPYASLLYPFKNARAISNGEMPPSELGARAIDAKTLELQVEQPTPFLATLLTHYTAFPVPIHKIEELGNAWVRPGSYVSNGPYVVEEWRPNSQIKLVKNERFYDADNVAIDTVYYKPIGDVSAAFRAFRAGEIDSNSCSQCYPIQQVNLIDEIMPGVKRNEVILSTTYLTFNSNVPPFDDARVRRALGLAIDRDILTEQVLRAGEVPAYGLTPPGIDNYINNPPQMAEADMTQEERLAIARNLLAEAGYDESNPLTINVKYRLAGDRRQIMVAMQDMWKRVGVTAKLEGKEPKVAYADYRARNFDVADAGWVADYNDPDNFLFLAKSDTGPINYADYANAEFDRLMTEANNTQDLDARAELMALAEAILLEDLPIAPIYFSVNRNLVGLHVKGWNNNVLGIQRTRWLSIDESARKKY